MHVLHAPLQAASRTRRKPSIILLERASISLIALNIHGSADATHLRSTRISIAETEYLKINGDFIEGMTISAVLSSVIVGKRLGTDTSSGREATFRWPTS